MEAATIWKPKLKFEDKGGLISEGIFILFQPQMKWKKAISIY